MRDDLSLALFPIRHSQVFLFFSKRINTLAFVSGSSETDAIRQLEKANPVWKVSRHFIACIPTRNLELAQMLDEQDRDYSTNAHTR